MGCIAACHVSSVMLHYVTLGIPMNSLVSKDLLKYESEKHFLNIQEEAVKECPLSPNLEYPFFGDREDARGSND